MADYMCYFIILILIFLVIYLFINRYKKVRSLRERFLKAFNLNPCMILITKVSDGMIIDVNNCCSVVTGYTRDEVIGRTTVEIGLWANSKDRCELHNHVKNGILRGFEHSFRTKGGEERISLISSEIITLEKSDYYLSVCQDITEYRQSEDRFYRTFHINPSLMCIISSEGIYLDVNSSFVEAKGSPRETIIGKSIADYSIWNIHDQQEELFKNKLHGYEVEYNYKSTEIRYGLLSVEPIVINGNKCFLCVMTDITDKKLLEAEMLQMDRLNIIGEMAAGIGHEVRNPLTTVRGYLQMFLVREEFKKYMGQLSTMIDELDRANAIISEFLSLAKNKKVELKPGNLNGTIHALYPLIQAEAFHSGHTILVDIDDIPYILYDDNEIRQLILNLVRNGMQAMNTGGTLTINTRHYDDKVILSIQDTGMGIPIGIQDKIGTPFFTTKEDGTGIGLSICYRIAQRHNAKIEFSTGSEGTTFTIRFDVAQ